MLVWRKEILRLLSLCYRIVYHCNGAQWYEQFLQVSRLYKALILFGFALSSERLCIFDLPVAICIVYVFVTSFSFLFSELSLVGLDLDLVVLQCYTIGWDI